VTGGAAFSATAALVGPRGLFHGSDVEVTIDPSQGLKTIVCELFTASLHKVRGLTDVLMWSVCVCF
jgi:hypothetical protein